METVSTVYHLFVHLEVVLGDTFHSGRMVVHELVTDLIDGSVIDRKKIPFGVDFHQTHSGVMCREGFREALGKSQ